jgi:hypothetical protein
VDIRALVDSAQARGLSFYLEGDKIKVEAANEPDPETMAILEQLRGHREELKRIMAGPPCWNCGATTVEIDDIYGETVWVCWACAKWA